MAPRKQPTEATQAAVLVQSRRRCCICFGLNKDAAVKKGQIAHVDGNRENSSLENLAFLCFDHHDEHDSTTSQSKGFTEKEVKSYRAELYSHFASWPTGQNREQLLNFLASTIDADMLADAAIKLCSQLTVQGAEHAYYVLVAPQVDYRDMDLVIPHQTALDYFASWGWLTYKEEEKEDEDGDIATYFYVTHEPICRRVADIIRGKVADGEGNLSLLEHFDNLARIEAART